HGAAGQQGAAPGGGARAVPRRHRAGGAGRRQGGPPGGAVADRGPGSKAAAAARAGVAVWRIRAPDGRSRGEGGTPALLQSVSSRRSGAPPFPLRSAATRSLRLLVPEDASLLQDGDYQEEEAGDRDHGVDQYQPDGE